jgi:hypothetical protein
MDDKDDELRRAEPAARPSAPTSPIAPSAKPLAPLVVPPRAPPPTQLVNGAIQINNPPAAVADVNIIRRRIAAQRRQVVNGAIRINPPAPPPAAPAPIAPPIAAFIAPPTQLVNGAIQINNPLVARGPLAPRAAPPIQVVNGTIQINPLAPGTIPYTNMVNNKQLDKLDELGQLNYETWNWKILNIKEDQLNPNARETSVNYITDNKN